ncbi:hypothetical protein QJS04_geneDACA021640 [Acorus gramineus]|uniref:Protein transport protein sec16 n=1 Tax=Acorus gramineus TaxID=55184 RepID=A0AAV9ACR1_ACOGR|nr:hypothetical protein QJS04_geneDACA021640 [Acorus gramineus]
MAASHPPFQVEDQTDEDFFDKLVDDEFGVSGSGFGDQSVAVGDAGMTRAFSNLSISDKGDVLEGLETEKDVLATAKEGTTPDLAGSDGVAAVAAEPVSAVSTDSDSGRSSGRSKVTCVKEVQWSALAVDSVKSDLAESGSYSDFLMELQDGPSEVVGELGDSKPTAEIDLATSFVENPVVDSTASLVSSENQDTQVHESVGDGTYWENMYPGWRYDASTGQWHQLDDYNAPVESTQVGLQEAVQSGGESADQRSDVSYLQQTAQSVVGTVSSEEYQVSQGAVDYPPNMVFDPQYPGWYYDMNTQQWNSLESYNQSVQMTSSVVQDQQPVPGANQQTRSFYGSMGQSNSYVEQQAGFSAVEPLHDKKNLDGGINNFMGYQSFNPVESTYQYNNQVKSDQQAQFSHHFQHKGPSFSQYPFSPNEGRSSAGRPPHALVSFGFGGKLIVMKDTSSFSSYGSQDTSGGTVSILNLMEVLSDKADAVAMGSEGSEYISALCHQSFPGPLVGGNASNKDVNKWMDERIANCDSVTMDFRKGESLRLLLSLLKTSFQHYGKLRSPFGSDRSVQEVDGPELAITKLLESTRKDDAHLREFGAFTHCMHNLPPEGQIQKTAVEVQTLLVSGKRREALRCAQDGQLWGPALALASQLGREFYVDTVKQMALKQLVSGSPLQTLCLLIAEQPVNSTSGVLSDAMNTSQQSQIIASGMLDDWEKNLAIITANRTVGDEAVITRLGYSLWRERGEIAAAHTCFLVAEALFEPYSDKAMMCLIGADHLRYPRTYANPAAIQRTELYEYTKVLGNSQYTLQPFQPYKLIYAYMLAEVGKLSDSLKYCQSILKSLKNFSRSPEIEPLKQLSSALEERLRTHQQGDHGTNLAPAKLVGKLFTSIDKSIHRMMGTPLPPSTQSTSLSNGQLDEHNGNSMAPKVANSQSTMTMSLLAPSASMEPISEWTTDSSRRSVHNRSVSEPDFGSYPKQSQDPSKEAASADAQGKSSGPSRFGRISSQLFQKTIGWVARSRSDHQAKLGETNKFYYDEKLKRWVEEGVEPQAAEAALPPPPTTASFMNGTAEYNINSVFKSQSILSNGEPEMKTVPLSEHSSGMPPIPPSSNQFSARSRIGVRSRYVDTFNKGGAAPTANLFHSTPAPVPKPLGNANFFVPTPIPSTENILESPGENLQEVSYTEAPSTSFMETAFSPPPTLSSSSSMQRFPSMDNIVQTGNRGMGTLQNGNGSISSRSRAASWSSGSFPNAFNPQIANIKPLGDMLGTRQPTNMTLAMNGGGGGGFGDELQEVEL